MGSFNCHNDMLQRLCIVHVAAQKAWSIIRHVPRGNARKPEGQLRKRPARNWSHRMHRAGLFGEEGLQCMERASHRYNVHTRFLRLSNISYLSRFVLILVTGCTTLRLQTAMGLEGPKGRMYISYMN